jgi:protein-tyrosine phosphatase
LGIELKNHRSQPVTQKLVREADLIVVMTSGHQYHLLHEFPEVEDKVYLLKSFGTSKVASDVADPFGGSLAIYKKTCDEIDRALSDLILFIHTGKL